MGIVPLLIFFLKCWNFFYFLFFLILLLLIFLLYNIVLVLTYINTHIVVQSPGCVWLFATPWTAAHQASLSSTLSQSLLKLMSIESVMPSNHLTLGCPLLLLPSIFPSIRVFFSNELALCIRGPKYQNSVLHIYIFFSDCILLWIIRSLAFSCHASCSGPWWLRAWALELDYLSLMLGLLK